MADTDSAIIDRQLRRWRGCQNRRGQFMTHWEDLARVMLPRRVGFITDVQPGERNTDELFDGTAMRAARGLANATAQMLRPEGEQWFFIKAADDELNEMDEVKSWLEAAQSRLWDAIFNPRARFRQAVGEGDLDLVVFGTAVMYVGRSKNGRHLTYQTVHLRRVSLGYDDEGNADTMFVEWTYTLRQAEEKFGRGALSKEMQTKLAEEKENALENPHQFLQVVTPRPNGNPEALLARNLPFSEMWIDIEHKHKIEETGYHEFPFGVGRWDTSSGEDYGRSPGMIALPDADTSQAQGSTILVAGQRMADPPLMAPNDGSFDVLNTYPGGIGYYDVETAVQMRGNPFFPLETGGNLPISRDMQRDTREQIEAAFFKNVFNLPIEGPQMTATEIIERKEEFIREIGPVFGRLESDYTAPPVERSFNIMLRSGSLPPIPEVLSGQQVTFEYESPVKRIREQAEAAAVRLWARETLEMAQLGKPEVADIVNADGVARFSHRALRLPEIVITPDEEVEQIRQQRAQAAQQAAEAEALAQTTQLANEGGQAAQSIQAALTPPQGS